MRQVPDVALGQANSHKKRLIVFGTGEMSKMLNLVPDYYVDNDEARWNTRFEGQLVQGPQALELEDKDSIVILVASQFYTEIADQLTEMGFTADRHFFHAQRLFEETIRRNYVFRTKRWMRNSARRLSRNVARRWRGFKDELSLILPPSMGDLSFQGRRALLRHFKRITEQVHCPHTQQQMIEIVDAILRIPPDIDGCIVEAGAYKGGSTSKLSIAAKLAGRDLYVFDSFQGLPDNTEPHDRSILGHSIRGWFRGGAYHGTLGEVRTNVATYGHIDVCHFIEGWFDDTMPSFDKPIAVAFLDVDLAASTKTCLKYLYPLLVPGGALFSHDGAFPLVMQVFDDDRFWEEEVGVKKPIIEGFGKKQLIKIVRS